MDAISNRRKLYPSMDECQSANVLLEPAHEGLSDFSAVLFGHHLMAIAGQPDIFEVYVRGLYTCLIEPPLHDAQATATACARRRTVSRRPFSCASVRTSTPLRTRRT